MKIKNKNNETLKAGCVVVNEKGEVLVVDANKTTFWSFPKGHAEDGEIMEEVALREVKEETGYEVQIVKQLPDATYFHGETGELIRVVMFQAKPLRMSGMPKEDMQSKWVFIQEALKIIYPNLRFILEELKF